MMSKTRRSVIWASARGDRLFRAVYQVRIVVKRTCDPCAPATTWFKIPNRYYSQKVSRAKLFSRQSYAPNEHSPLQLRNFHP
jgi:hypothetical protein